MSREAAGAAVMAALYLALFLAAEFWARRGGVKLERPRKAVHIGAGLLSLALPRCVQSPWTAFGMALSFAAFCLAGRRIGFLRCLKSERPSLGSELVKTRLFKASAEAEKLIATRR